MAPPIDFFALEAHILARLQTLDTPEMPLVFKGSIEASDMTLKAISAKPTFVVSHMESPQVDRKPGAALYKQRYAIYLCMRGAVKERTNDGVLLLRAMQLFMGQWTPDRQVWTALEAEPEGVVSDYVDNVRQHLFVVSSVLTIRG